MKPAQQQSSTQDWNMQHPQWSRATVWAAHVAACTFETDLRAPPGSRRCAGCAAYISDAKKNCRCSRCKQVFFCNKACQQAALPVHKHFCCPSEQSRDADARAKVIYDQAVEQSKTLPPTEVPESLGLLLLTVETHKHMKNSGDSHMISKEDTYRAVWAATWSCNYYWEQRKDSQQAQAVLSEALRISAEVKDWMLQSDIWKDLIRLSRQNDRGPSTLQRCKAAIRIAEKHQDIHLLAIANSAAADLGPITNGMPYKKESCQLWWAMLKAAITLQMDVEPMITSCANSLLRDTFRLCEWLSDEWRTDEAEEWLLQAQQWTRFGRDPKQEHLNVLLALANHCEMYKTPTGIPDQRHKDRAAEYRQQLFVAMIDQGHEVPRECGRCHKAISAHKPSIVDGLTWVMMSTCWHIFHVHCYRMNSDCPVCHQPLLVMPE